MSKVPKQQWAFATRFRRRAFGWRSQPAIARIKEAVSEIKKAVRKDPLLGAEGAVLLLEKLSPAYRHTMQAATNAGCAEQVLERIRALVCGREAR